MLSLLVPLSHLALLLIGLYLAYTAVVMTPPFLSGLAFTLIALNFLLPMLLPVPQEAVPEGFEGDMDYDVAYDAPVDSE